jgi:biopolymer transport protein ExbD
MQFTSGKRRGAPSVIIVSLIDVLIVVLIFLVLTTTYKQQPAVKLALPESKQQKDVAHDNAQTFIVTIAKQPPIYLNQDPVTLDRLQIRLTEAVQRNPQTALAIRADTDAPFGQIIKVMDAAKAANIKVVSAFTKNGTH